MKQLPASVYDFYEKENFIMTGTAREISERLGFKNKNCFSTMFKLGKESSHIEVKEIMQF